jgi:hypothetical protein
VVPIRPERGRPAPILATAVDGLAVMAAIDAARRSAEGDGSWCDVRAVLA